LKVINSTIQYQCKAQTSRCEGRYEDGHFPIICLALYSSLLFNQSAAPQAFLQCRDGPLTFMGLYLPSANHKQPQTPPSQAKVRSITTQAVPRLLFFNPIHIRWSEMPAPMKHTTAPDGGPKLFCLDFPLQN